MVELAADWSSFEGSAAAAAVGLVLVAAQGPSSDSPDTALIPH